MSTLTTDYGTDCRIGKVVTKVSGLQNLMDALVRRLSTPTGSLFWDLEYGYDVRAVLNSEISVEILKDLESRVVHQLELDGRVDKATCDATFIFSTQKLTLRISITPVQDKTFTLVIGVSKLTVELLDSSLNTA